MRLSYLYFIYNNNIITVVYTFHPLDPNITVIVNGIATPSAGETYSLNCGVSGADSFNVTYQWQKNSSNLSSETGSVLSFTTLRLSDAGRYSCLVRVSSTLFSQETVVSSNPFELTFQSECSQDGWSSRILPRQILRQSGWAGICDCPNFLLTTVDQLLQCVSAF